MLVFGAFILIDYEASYVSAENIQKLTKMANLFESIVILNIFLTLLRKFDLSKTIKNVLLTVIVLMTF